MYVSFFQIQKSEESITKLRSRSDGVQLKYCFIDCPSCSMILYLGQVLPVPVLSSGTGGACQV